MHDDEEWDIANFDVREWKLEFDNVFIPELGFSLHLPVVKQVTQDDRNDEILRSEYGLNLHIDEVIAEEV